MEFLSKMGHSSDDSLVPKHKVAEMEHRRRRRMTMMMIEGEQQMVSVIKT